MFLSKGWSVGLVSISADNVQKALNNGLKHKHVYARIDKLGWSVERAVNTPVLPGKPCCYTDDDVKEAAANGISWNTFRCRIHNSKWTVEKAKKTPLKKYSNKDKEVSP